MTREQKNAWQREQRRRIGNVYTHRYEKTPSGFLMRAYRNMQSRVTGVQWRKAHLYEGKPLLSRGDFYEWAKGSAAFWVLFRAWEASGHDRKLCPSVNRIDPKCGYELDNMEWVTHSANSARTSRRAA